MTVIASTDRFQKKREVDTAGKTQLDYAVAFEEAGQLFPGNPLWPIAGKIQREFADEKYRDQHSLYTAVVSQESDTTGKLENVGESVAVLWRTKVRPDHDCFMSLQSTHQIRPDDAEAMPDYDMLEAMLADLLDDYGRLNPAVAMFIESSIRLFIENELDVVYVDISDDGALFDIQAYVKGQNLLIDVQFDLSALAEDCDVSS
jgi:hypothetical protein